MKTIACGCGCNTLIPEYDTRGRPRRFARGHASDFKAEVYPGKPTRYDYNKTWRRRHSELRHAQKISYRTRTGSGTGPNLNTAWTADDDELVMARSVSDRRLAQILGRSVQAIQVRRWRLKQRPDNPEEPRG